MIHNTYPCYSSNDQKNVLLSNATPIGVHKMRRVAECRLHTGGVGLSFLDSSRPTNISALMMRIKPENFPGATSVISRPATCQVAIAGEHFFAAKLVRGVEVVLCWKRAMCYACYV